MKRQYNRLFVLGVSVLLSLAFCPPYEIMIDDKEIFRYGGMVILRGGVPYRDFFDHKPPLIFFINAVGILLGGHWGLWVFNTLLVLLATGLLFDLCRQYKLHYPWLLPLLFNLMIRDNLISSGINMTREYTAIFTMIFFCILLGKYRYRYFWLGLLSALILFTQQDQMLPLLPFLLYLLLSAGTDPLITRLLRLGAGFMTVTLPLLLYFALHRALDYFWRDAFLFNFTVYTAQKKSLGDHFRSIKRSLDAGNYEIPVMTALILGTTCLFLQNKKKPLVLCALAALALTMSPEFMGGRLSYPGVPEDFVYYFLALSSSVCILLFTVFAFTEDDVLSDKKAQLPYALLLCCSLGYTAIQHATHLQRRYNDPVMRTAELNYLRRQKPGDYQLFVFFNNQYIYFYTDLKILSPSPWIYHHFWRNIPQWDPDHRVLASIGDDLLRHRTTYVIMDTSSIRSIYRDSTRDWWVSFMRAHYQPVALPGTRHSMLWQRK